MRLILREADQLGVPVLASRLIFNLYRTLQRDRAGGEATTPLSKHWKNWLGLESIKPGLGLQEHSLKGYFSGANNLANSESINDSPFLPFTGLGGPARRKAPLRSAQNWP